MTTEASKADEQSTGAADPELKAIQAVLAALSGLQAEQRQRVIDYVFQRLGLEGAQRASPSPSATLTAHVPVPPTVAPSMRDIRSLKEHKKPRSANEMAALVAYYLSELAPEGSRKSEIGTEDITTYFKQAGYPLPAVLRNTLVNAKASGYFDSASHGLYKLNPVGHNLVVHGLPSSGDETRTANRPKRKTRKAAARSKGAKHR